MARSKDARFPEYEWFCAKCGESISNQTGFDDNKFTWKCLQCGYKNSISKDNLIKPYAYLKEEENDTILKKILHFFIGIIRSIYGILSRTILYCFIACIVSVMTRQTTIEQLSWGLVSPYSIEDYFSALLFCSGGIVLLTLLLYGITKKFVGKPDTKKHFFRETLHFFRDNLLFPISIIKSIFDKTTIIKKLRTLFSLAFLIATIAFLIYGCINWI